MFKKICVLFALIMLAVVLGPVSATVAPGEPSLITTVVIVAPADGKGQKKDSTAHHGGYFCIGAKGPPADSYYVVYSQENVFADQDTLIEADHNTKETADHNTGMNDCCLKPIGDAPFAGIPGRP